jgi:hypothetical protein
MDDTTRGIGNPDEFEGRGDETILNRAGAERDPAVRATGSSATTPSRRKGASTSTTATRPSSSTDAQLDPETDRRTRELQQEIADTREEMSETIDALQEKLKPGNIVADATERVKSVTTEKVKNMAESASGTAQELLRDTREGAYGIIEGARQNPIPALMIGAGVAWLLMDQSRSRGDRYSRGSRWQGTSETQYGSYGSAYGESYGRRSAYGTGDYGTGSTVGSAGTGGRIAERARETLNEARYTTRRTTRRAQSQLQRMLNDNPIAVAAAAVVIGAAVGAALPETERENELMGDARDSVIDRAQEMAHNVVGTVQEVASDATTEVVNKVTGTRQP